MPRYSIKKIFHAKRDRNSKPMNPEMTISDFFEVLAEQCTPNMLNKNGP